MNDGEVPCENHQYYLIRGNLIQTHYIQKNTEKLEERLGSKKMKTIDSSSLNESTLNLAAEIFFYLNYCQSDIYMKSWINLLKNYMSNKKSSWMFLFLNRIKKSTHVQIGIQKAATKLFELMAQKKNMHDLKKKNKTG